MTEDLTSGTAGARGGHDDSRNDPWRVVLVDDRVSMRARARAVLAEFYEFEVVGEAEDGEGAVTVHREVKPDLIVMPFALPGLSGGAAAQIIREETPGAAVVLTVTDAALGAVESLLRAGVRGCVHEVDLEAELAPALGAVAQGKVHVPCALRAVGADGGRRAAAPGRTLTPRERQILGRVVRGCTSAQIARELSLSVHAVEVHRADIMTRFDAADLASFVRVALEGPGAGSPSAGDVPGADVGTGIARAGSEPGPVQPLLHLNGVADVRSAHGRAHTGDPAHRMNLDRFASMRPWRRS